MAKPQKSNRKIFVLSLILVSAFIWILVFSFKPVVPRSVESQKPYAEIRTRTLIVPEPETRYRNPTRSPESDDRGGETTFSEKQPAWFDLIGEEFAGRKRLRIGLFNVPDGERWRYEVRKPDVENVHVEFKRVPKSLKWEDLFPEWIDEEHKWGAPKCPEIPLPTPERVRHLDVIFAKVPCRGWNAGKGLRDVFRLQVNLVAANAAAESGWIDLGVNRTVYVVFEGFCGPIQEIFRCDDLVRHVGDYWVYRPDPRRLMQKVAMPHGSCEIAPPLSQPGKESWRPDSKHRKIHDRRREAYVTVLHSSESYVCGAIALAQSIRQSKSKRDLVLLHDSSLSSKSRVGLEAAGWRLREIQRIRSPFAKPDSYNEWNYSKLRVWQLTEYDKLIFIDADLIVLKNLDHLFYYPQLSAAGNDRTLFNSGVMVLEPSNCMFENLMKQSFKLRSYNGGDQGFLNEVFTWWHRLPRRVNHLKVFARNSGRRDVPENLYAMHYLGLKPWMCYRDYDCNWDISERQIFASDAASMRWWKVYDKMPYELQAYCALSPKMDARIRKWRRRAKEAGFRDRHWEIKVKDPRKDILVE